MIAKEAFLIPIDLASLAKSLRDLAMTFVAVTSTSLTHQRLDYLAAIYRSSLPLGWKAICYQPF